MEDTVFVKTTVKPEIRIYEYYKKILSSFDRIHR